MSLVRDAMLPDPPWLAAGASAQEAGVLLARPEVRAIFVCGDDGALSGVITRKTLVREVVALGRDPQKTPVGEIAEEPHYTIDSSDALDAAFRFLEEHDAERVPVVDGGRLVGVLSRSVLQRRLAEDEAPDETPETQGQSLRDNGFNTGV
jgi:CBS domain-containing protein